MRAESQESVWNVPVHPRNGNFPHSSLMITPWFMCSNRISHAFIRTLSTDISFLFTAHVNRRDRNSPRQIPMMSSPTEVPDRQSHFLSAMITAVTLHGTLCPTESACWETNTTNTVCAAGLKTEKIWSKWCMTS